MSSFLLSLPSNMTFCTARPRMSRCNNSTARCSPSSSGGSGTLRRRGNEKCRGIGVCKRVSVMLPSPRYSRRRETKRGVHHCRNRGRSATTRVEENNTSLSASRRPQQGNTVLGHSETKHSPEDTAACSSTRLYRAVRKCTHLGVCGRSFRTVLLLHEGIADAGSFDPTFPRDV